MKWLDDSNRALRHASLLLHEDNLPVNMHPRCKRRPNKATPQATRAAKASRAAVASILSVFDHVEEEEEEGGEQDAAIIAHLVTNAALGTSPPEAAQQQPGQQQQRTVSDAAADGVLAQGLALSAAAAAGPSGIAAPQGPEAVVGAAGGAARAVGAATVARADSKGCFDLGALIHEALQRHLHDKDERLLRQRLAEWVSVSRAASAAVADVHDAPATGLGGGALLDEEEEGDTMSEDSFVLV